MTRFTILLALALVLVASAAVALRVGAASDTSVIVAGSGLFPSGAQLYGVDLSSSTIGSGVRIHTSGGADGVFSTVLSGSQDILVEGLAQSGTANPDGSATFAGTSTVTTAGQVLSGVPFSVTLTSSGFTLVVGTTTLPTQKLSEGGIYIGN